MNQLNARSSKQRNHVTEMTILTRTIEKENRNMRIYDTYHVNPSRVCWVSEKPNVQAGRYDICKTHRGNAGHDALDNYIAKTLKMYKETPRARGRYPRTASQDIGWFNHIKDIEGFQSHRRVDSRESRFDEAYLKLKGISQFSKRNKLN